MPLRAGWKVDESSRSRRVECRPGRWASCSGKRTRLRTVNPAAMKASVQAVAFCPVDPIMAILPFILVVAFVPSVEHRAQKPARRVTEQIKQCHDSLMSGGSKNGGARLPDGLAAITKGTNRSPLNGLNWPLNVPSRGPAQTTAPTSQQTRSPLSYVGQVGALTDLSTLSDDQRSVPSASPIRPFGSRPSPSDSTELAECPTARQALRRTKFGLPLRSAQLRNQFCLLQRRSGQRQYHRFLQWDVRSKVENRVVKFDQGTSVSNANHRRLPGGGL
jgi:hypothetical protein